MKLFLLLIKTGIQLLSLIAPKQAANLAFDLFQKPQNRSFKANEKAFYAKTKPLTLKSKLGTICYYEQGSDKDDLVLLVHGWESNAGSMSAIAEAVSQKGYRVVSIDLPAHGLSKEKRINPKLAGSHVLDLLAHLNPTQPFSIVSHSLGSMITAYNLGRTTYKINQLIYLTAPRNMESIFVEYKSIIGINDKAYKMMVELGSNLLNDTLENVDTKIGTAKIDYRKLSFVHDRFDKMLDFTNSEGLVKALPNSTLYPFEKIGHYRMLFNPDVIALICQILRDNPLEHEDSPTASTALSA
jgi:pimeloyl-ACP methyl ester carboxylesterase